MSLRNAAVEAVWCFDGAFAAAFAGTFVVFVATLRGQGKAPSSSHGGKKRSGSNVAIVPHGGERPPRKGINPKKRGGKRGEKRRRNTSSSPPYGDLIRRTSSSNTLGTYESPQFFPENVGPETFSNDVTDKEYKCSLCQVEYSACSYDESFLCTYCI